MYYGLMYTFVYMSPFCFNEVIYINCNLCYWLNLFIVGEGLCALPKYVCAREGTETLPYGG